MPPADQNLLEDLNHCASKDPLTVDHDFIAVGTLHSTVKGAVGAYGAFLPARRYATAGLCDSDVSVCLSVCHTPVLCLAQRKQDREMYTI